MNSELKTTKKPDAKNYSLELGKRIVKVTEIVGGKSVLARMVDTYEANIYRYINATNAIAAHMLVKIANVSGVTVNWLATGEGPMLKGHELKRPQDVEEYVYIPLYNISTSAGRETFLNRTGALDSIAFKTSWIFDVIHSPPEDLTLVHVTGDSMEPTLSDKDLVMIDRGYDAQKPRDGLFLVRLDETLLVKRLQCLIGGQIEISSDSSGYKPFTVNLDQVDEKDFAVIGQVVWVGKKI